MSTSNLAYSRSTIPSREIQTSVRLILPGEHAKHAISEGTKSVTKFAPAVIACHWQYHHLLQFCSVFLPPPLVHHHPVTYITYRNGTQTYIYRQQSTSIYRHQITSIYESTMRVQLTGILESLMHDAWPVANDKQPLRCMGVALSVALGFWKRLTSILTHWSLHHAFCR
jgi:hypothetical protein